jgi:hypothetical protein
MVSSATVNRNKRLLIAGGYWLSCIAIYTVGLSQQNNEGDGPTVVVTLPWSVLMLGAGVALESIIRIPATTLANFIMFPVICGGANAATIYAVLAPKILARIRRAGSTTDGGGPQ